MRIIAFIVDHGGVGTILRHLERTQPERQRGPPENLNLSAAS